MKYKNYLFDLDGTLTDPGLGIKNSIRYALDKAGLPALDDATLNCFIGPPLLDSFQKYCGATPDEAKELVRLYREYFSVTGLFENEVYRGVPELLDELCRRGAKVFLATSKPELFAVKILEHFDLMKYFTFAGGSTMDETRTAKAEVIDYVLKSANIKAEESVMVGDRKYDIEGGEKCGLDTVGVTFGYGTESEFANADYIINSPEELLNI
jgi:phosphoglycolate phosphatase